VCGGSGMVENRADPESKLKVFISYSRKDAKEFADELAAGLDLAGFKPFLDRHDISAGENWETRLRGLIREADTVVFVVSPEAVRSERCRWEVDETVAQSKRLLPVIFKTVHEAELPQQLSCLQFVRFDTGPGITQPLSELAKALRQDLEWIREHTRLGEIAMRWEGRGRPGSLLLRGDDLEAALSWIKRRKGDAPEISDLQRALVNASVDAEYARAKAEKVARGRVRRVQAGFGLLVAATVAGIAVWWQQQWLNELQYWITDVRGKVKTAEEERELKPLEKDFKECANDCPEMVVVPAGEFMMGAAPREVGDKDEMKMESPQHKVTIAKPFAVSRVEVTLGQWDVCVRTGGCPPISSEHGLDRRTHPVINVSWFEAQQYTAWLSKLTGKQYRLLSEAEWEYAARAGTTTLYSFGNNKEQLSEYAWYVDNTPRDENHPLGWAQPVGKKKPNAFGLHDMHGNVWEWCADNWHETYKGAPNDGSVWLGGNTSKRVLRGGSFDFEPPSVRSAWRDGYVADKRNEWGGFRVARTLSSPTP
jgi:formylglycine-generating enzyme required for sulfatase activity